MKTERKYFKDIGYKPFLFYIVFGVSGEDLEVSREKHKVDELPEGLDIRIFTREAHGEWIDGWFTGTYGSVLKKADASILEICQSADICTVLQGTIKNDATLDYMRNVIGIIQAFIDKGALGILDPQTIAMYSPDQWTDRFFDKEVNAQNHVIILSSEDSDGYWLHTRGMAEFGRPDIGINCVLEDKIHDYTQLINQMIYYGGQGVFFENDTRLHTSDGKTFVIHPEFVNDFDDDDYNNAYYNVTIIEDIQ
ncbi:hypothetical protein [Butyrivibrio fibrisolvens]|uniref:hypothetical protein n=1 Tax=Butyrivibrio fibrisolvens TaxID=831 RepID=UPI0004178F6D|nr:hypothetical protein [Butyrivibrio fibrisolvens]